MLSQASDGVVEYGYAEYEEYVEQIVWQGMIDSIIEASFDFSTSPTLIVEYLEDAGFTVADQGTVGTETTYRVTKDGRGFTLTFDTATGDFNILSDIDET